MDYFIEKTDLLLSGQMEQKNGILMEIYIEKTDLLLNTRVDQKNGI